MVFLPSLALTTQDTLNRIAHGAGGYNSDLWQQSETIRYLRSHALESGMPVYSNAPEALYISTEVRARISPRKSAYNSPESKADDLPNIRASWPESPKAYLMLTQ
jgi:hypothetical protein